MNDNDRLVESWSTFYSFQIEGRRLYKSIWRIPLIKKLQHAFVPLMTDGCAILDVGAHDRKLGMQLATLRPAIHYQSMDVDPAGEHDFRSMSEIGDEQFDLVNCSEVIEHIPFEDGVALLKEILRVLKPGGRVVVSTPNLKHPHRYWTSPDHITPYNYDALAGILLGVGYEMEVMYRVHNQPFFQFYFRRLIGVWLHWYLDIDFALSVIAVARRPNDS